MSSGENTDKPMIIKISGLGNIGNRMMQYISAVRFARHFPNARIERVSLPEWGIEFDHSGETAPTDDIMHVDDHFRDEQHLVSTIRDRNPDVVFFTGYLQKTALFGDHREWKDIFSEREEVDVRFGDNDLVVSIRTGEIVEGYYQYPLIPIEFYRHLEKTTGMNLVFVGQITDNGYSRDLRDAFPHSRFIPHISPMKDFEILRRAKNVVVGISTFSFLATWLSDAEKIILPLWGFFSIPCHLNEIELLPPDDDRYEFWLFPFVPGLPEAQMREISASVAGMCRKTDMEEIISIRNRINSISVRETDFQVDDTWYASRYPDASLDIALGYFRNPYDHYTRTGVWEGRLPTPPTRPDLPNVASGKKALVSSFSEYAAGASAEEQARAAVDGPVEGDCAFHTKDENYPWWQVDLGQIHRISYMIICNREGGDILKDRCLPLGVYSSEDGVKWYCVRVHRQLFGGMDGHPLEINLHPAITARHILLVAQKHTYFHLEQVQIFGVPDDRTGNA
ncbi:hypothetical protein GOB93_06555 [Acetobacter musti]|uniref:F5/8 type C domain-containing protein n=1 Tax=Acetobacter musti TaxID=864732 RepID=A0ABX0JP84_9PROT|nr:discoidin domain-containing protein [Acetobacter musti]NHN84306.1 hypothetical protein [Acetobacter musti]